MWRKADTGKDEVITKERELKAFELRKTGLSLAEIGKKLDITPQGVSKILKRVLEKLSAASLEKADDVRAMEVERLDRMFLGLWNSARRGNHASIDKALKIMERRSRLLGLDLDVESKTNINVFMKSIKDMTNNQLMEEAKKAMNALCESGADDE